MKMEFISVFRMREALGKHRSFVTFVASDFENEGATKITKEHDGHNVRFFNFKI